MDVVLERARMVREQLEARGIADPRVLAAMGAVPRELFLPEGSRELAYADSPVPIGFGQTISQPYIVAYMTEALQVRGAERVLEVGSGSGYQAAVLASIGCRVVTVERLPPLVEQARANLEAAGVTEVRVEQADGTVGWPAGAPYERILVTAGGPEVPATLAGQLAEGGVLVMPVGTRWHQELVRLRERGGAVEREALIGCVFVPLVGAEGWKESR